MEVFTPLTTYLSYSTTLSPSLFIPLPLSPPLSPLYLFTSLYLPSLSLSPHFLSLSLSLYPLYVSLLAPKMNPSLWSHFVVDSMAIGSFLRLVLSFF
jgi:hypothetical protein